MAPLLNDAPAGVYIHVPFCSHICPYCDFNTYAGMEGLIPAYVRALCEEIDRFPQQFGSRDAATLFFGGGTPSLLSADQVGLVIEAVRSSFTLMPDAEITIEANPNHFGEKYCVDLLAAGVSRISLGAQTFDRRGLRTLGRQHEATDVFRAIDAARNAGFANVSIDLIFGWPGQSMDVWEEDLDRILTIDPGVSHLSLYSLIVEPGTPMAEAVKRGILTPVSDDEAADFYELACHVLARAGWVHYEIANWAIEPAFQSRHNMVYWRNGEYAGFGAGAHWRIGDIRRMNHLLPRTYIDAIERGDRPVSNEEQLTSRMSMGETMMLGLRLLEEGVTGAEFLARHGVSMQQLFESEIKDLVDQRLLIAANGRVRLSERGIMLANEVCSRFL